jgi:hypothetical protein
LSSIYFHQHSDQTGQIDAHGISIENNDMWKEDGENTHDKNMGVIRTQHDDFTPAILQHICGCDIIYWSMKVPFPNTFHLKIFLAPFAEQKLENEHHSTISSLCATIIVIIIIIIAITSHNCLNHIYMEGRR